MKKVTEQPWVSKHLLLMAANEANLMKYQIKLYVLYVFDK